MKFQNIDAILSDEFLPRTFFSLIKWLINHEISDWYLRLVLEKEGQNSNIRENMIIQIKCLVAV